MNKLINWYPNPNSVLFSRVRFSFRFSLGTYVSIVLFSFFHVWLQFPSIQRSYPNRQRQESESYVTFMELYYILTRQKIEKKIKTTKAESNVCVYIHHLIRSVTKNSQVEPLHGDDD